MLSSRRSTWSASTSAAAATQSPSIISAVAPYRDPERRSFAHPPRARHLHRPSRPAHASTRPAAPRATSVAVHRASLTCPVAAASPYRRSRRGLFMQCRPAAHRRRRASSGPPHQSAPPRPARVRRRRVAVYSPLSRLREPDLATDCTFLFRGPLRRSLPAAPALFDWSYAF